MNDLIDAFIANVLRLNGLSIERKIDRTGTTVEINGWNGSASVEFAEDEIRGEIDTIDHFFHAWQMLPNHADLKSGARKIAAFLAEG